MRETERRVQKPSERNVSRWKKSLTANTIAKFSTKVTLMEK
jgi:hypothetical protein